MQASIAIVPARPEHAEGIATVQHDTWLATYPNEAAGVTLAAVTEHVRHYRSPERLAKWRDIITGEEHVTVALDGGRVVGFSCAKRTDGLNHLTAIYVLPAYHGTGIAQRLMEAALTWLGPGRDTLVEVASYNARAIRFYETYGFVATGESGHHKLIPTIFMRRPQ